MALGCNSFWPHDVHYSTHLTVVISIVAVITVVMNSMLIYALFKTKQTHTNTFRFIAAMSISDFFQGVLVMPATAITITIRDSHKSCFIDQATHYGFYLFGYFSYFMLMSITFDRLYILRRHHRVAKVLTKKQFAIFVIVILVVTCIGSYCGVAYISFQYQMVLMIVNVCLITSVFGSYACLLHKVRVHNVTVTKKLANSKFEGRVSVRVDTNASRVVWLLLVVLIITYVPFNVTTPWLSYVKYEMKVIPNSGLSIATMWAYALIFTYAFLNAFIFMRSNGKIRRYIWREFNGLLGARESSTQTNQRRTNSEAF